MNKIKLVIAIFFSAWLFTSSLSAQSPSWDRGTFGNVGVVGQIKHNSIIIDDGVYRLSPVAKFTTPDKDDANFDLLKVQQMVGYTFIAINGRLMVDHIWLIPESEKSLYRPQF